MKGKSAERGGKRGREVGNERVGEGQIEGVDLTC